MLLNIFKCLCSKHLTQNKNHRKKKACFWKEIVENADLHKPVLKELMTTQEKFIKYYIW